MASAPPAASASPSNPASTSRRTASDFLIAKSEREAARNWDIFYKKNEIRFFKDRHWTDREFEDLSCVQGEGAGGQDQANTGSGDVDDEVEWEESALMQQAAQAKGKGKARAEPVLLEVGCGVGNMIYPLLEKYPNLKGHCCDFSKRAIEFVKSHPSYDPARVNAFVYDLCSVPPEPTLASLVCPAVALSSEGGQNAEQSPAADPSRIAPPTIISMIFVLSAIPPHLQEQVLRSIAACLPRPPPSSSEQSDEDPDSSSSGTILFRDYAHGDMAQSRFDAKNATLPAYHESSLLSSSLPYYRRGTDNTLAYFFKKEELEALAHRCGLQGKVEVKRRVEENRKNGKILERVFLQARWTLVPQSAPTPESS